jgi:hypothetical protein
MHETQGNTPGLPSFSHVQVSRDTAPHTSRVALYLLLDVSIAGFGNTCDDGFRPGHGSFEFSGKEWLV